MNSIGMNGDSSVQNAASGRAARRHPVAEGAVADLVVVLGEDDEPLGGHVVGGGAEAAMAELRVAAVVDVGAVKRLGQLVDAAEVGVVAVALLGDQRAQRVMEVVGPGGVAVIAAAVARAHHLGVVEPGLGDHVARRA